MAQRWVVTALMLVSMQPIGYSGRMDCDSSGGELPGELIRTLWALFAV